MTKHNNRYDTKQIDNEKDRAVNEIKVHDNHNNREIVHNKTCNQEHETEWNNKNSKKESILH